ncbi:MAG: UPF0149 family protein [Gammaproteobacteria bacterium]|nr:UPF0149 family protein [Gammaproteobacteria bacterium]
MTMDYAVCREALSDADSSVHPSECHGLMCGLLCASERFPEDRWLKEVFADASSAAPVVESCANTLRAARRETERQLAGDGFEFRPMLPADNEPLRTRGEALAGWCRGFLYGLALGGMGEAAAGSAEVREVLNDLSEFTRLDVSGLQTGSEALESDYAEIVEYLRAGVMLVHTELRSRFEGPGADDALH